MYTWQFKHGDVNMTTCAWPFYDLRCRCTCVPEHGRSSFACKTPCSGISLLSGLSDLATIQSFPVSLPLSLNYITNICSSSPCHIGERTYRMSTNAGRVTQPSPAQPSLNPPPAIYVSGPGAPLPPLVVGEGLRIMATCMPWCAQLSPWWLPEAAKTRSCQWIGGNGLIKFLETPVVQTNLNSFHFAVFN